MKVPEGFKLFKPRETKPEVQTCDGTFAWIEGAGKKDDENNAVMRLHDVPLCFLRAANGRWYMAGSNTEDDIFFIKYPGFDSLDEVILYSRMLGAEETPD